MAIATVGTVGFPVLTFLGLPKAQQPEQSLEVPLDRLTEDSATWGEHLGRQIVVIKVGGEVHAFDGACTHLGCVIQWDGAARSFKCPCHGAAFSNTGAPVSGPVNIPLRRVEFTIKDGVLKVS